MAPRFIERLLTFFGGDAGHRHSHEHPHEHHHGHEHPHDHVHDAPVEPSADAARDDGDAPVRQR